MASDDELDGALDDLYGNDPASFVAARNALVKRLRAAGEREAAADVAQLRRPAVTAWALNRVRRDHPDLVDALLVGRDELEAAQRGRAGRDLRAALSAHRANSRAVLGAAAEVLTGAGRDPGSSALELRQLLDAVLATEPGRARLRVGRVTGQEGEHPEGDDDLTELLQAAAPRRGAGGGRHGHGAAADGDDPRKRREEAARAEVDEADAALADAVAARDDARDAQRAAAAALRDAERRLATAEREVGQAEARLERARQKLDRARGGGPQRGL